MNKESLLSALVQNKVIDVNFKCPVTFKSKVISPIYCDLRMCTSYPFIMRMLKQFFIEKFHGQQIDCIVGVATGALSHSQNIAEGMSLPSGYIRPDAKAKDYGLSKTIEGLGSVEGKTVLLVEDVVTSGASVINNIEILKVAGAGRIIVTCIFSYDFPKTRNEFQKAGHELLPLTTLVDLLPLMKEKLNDGDYELLEDWSIDHENWFEKHKRKFDFGFLTTLRQSAYDTSSLACMGLDPNIRSLPEPYRKNGILGYTAFMKDVLQSMYDIGVTPGMFKPNRGYFEVFDTPYNRTYDGSNALAELMETLRIFNVPIILDSKMGDIGPSSENYKNIVYSNWRADAATIAPYMGEDSIFPFAEHCNKVDKRGGYVLCRTSNPGSKTLQSLELRKGGLVYEATAEMIIALAKKHPGIGAVAGGTSPDDLRKILRLFAGKSIPVLVPGVGKQGGSASEVTEIALDEKFEPEMLRTSSSSATTHPWFKNESSSIPGYKECIDIIVNAVRTLNQQIGWKHL